MFGNYYYYSKTWFWAAIATAPLSPPSRYNITIPTKMHFSKFSTLFSFQIDPKWEPPHTTSWYYFIFRCNQNSKISLARDNDNNNNATSHRHHNIATESLSRHFPCRHPPMCDMWKLNACLSGKLKPKMFHSTATTTTNERTNERTESMLVLNSSVSAWFVRYLRARRVDGNIRKPSRRTKKMCMSNYSESSFLISSPGIRYDMYITISWHFDIHKLKFKYLSYIVCGSVRPTRQETLPRGHR